MHNQQAIDAEISFMTGVGASGLVAQNSFWRWNANTPATYHDTAKIGKWGATTAGTGATITYAFDPAANFSASEKALFAATFAMWSAVANIQFVETSSIASSQIDIKTWNVRGAYQGVSSGSSTVSHVGSATLNQFTSGTINVDSRNRPNASLAPGQFWYILQHEIGHILGLGHTGPYDFNTVNTMTQQYGPYDSLLWSIMSYIPPDCISAYDDEYEYTDTDWQGAYSTSWMPLDILAIQRLYGKPVVTPLSGGQTFGFHCTVEGAIAPVFDFTQNTIPVVTLWSAGGGNTLDLSGFAEDARVDLNPGTFSSAAGLTNNIGIAFETSIDTLVCGTGDDSVTCNDNGDTVTGGAGDDTIRGGVGFDTAVYAGAFSSYAITRHADGSVTVAGAEGTDSLTGVERLRFADRDYRMLVSPSDFDGDGKSDILWVSASGQVAAWRMNGAVMAASGFVATPGSQWSVAGIGDFDADGKADILWKSAAGEVAIWTMNGMAMKASGFVATPGSQWSAVGTGDFDGDGKADILWKSASGDVAIWTMNGMAMKDSGFVATPGAQWSVAGTGDFDGDGKADILWTSAAGEVAIWEMNGMAMKASGFVATPGSQWSVEGTSDYNGDGKADILWHNETSGDYAVWMMDGMHLSSSAILSASPDSRWSAVA